jgi:hypothetical protein
VADAYDEFDKRGDGYTRGVINCGQTIDPPMKRPAARKGSEEICLARTIS